MKRILSHYKALGALRSLVLSLIALGFVTAAWSTAIPEPETVFYGRVLVRSGGQDHVVQDGTLVWSVSRPDDALLVFETKLEAVGDGAYSYTLKLPHEAVSLGLDPSSGPVVSLGSTSEEHDHLSITIDGQAATIVIPGGGSFTTEQLLRAQTLRLQLRVDLDLLDSDGDGIDDWWEDKYGFDKQLASDAGQDADGDGMTNLAEFLGGFDPNHNNEAPDLLTGELLVYADGTSGMHLQVADTDSGPDELFFTVSALPATGTLQLREPELVVEVGTAFTQGDLNRGRLVYAHEGDEDISGLGFEVVVRDEDPEHPASSGTVRLNVFSPGESAVTDPNDSPERQQRFRNHLLGRDEGYTIWDFQDMPRPLELDLSGSTFAHVLVGGLEADDLSGGDENDVLFGSAGDDTLHGGPGADVFTILATDQGDDTIADFQPDEGDAIDLTLALDGSSSLASDYLLVSGSQLGIDFNGDGSGFTDSVISLPGNDFVAGDLRRLIDRGNLLLSGIGLPIQVSIDASLASSASENDPGTAAELTVTRSGSIEQELQVQLIISGSATNGLDYSLLSSALVFPAGERSAVLRVRPFADSLTEQNEIVEISVASGAGYELGATSSAQIVIMDLMPQLAVEALVDVAVMQPATPGVFLLSRTGVIDRSVLVRLSIEGTASNGSDYELVSSFLNFSAGETSALLEIIPTSPATSWDGSESVVIRLIEDATYLVGDEEAAQVTIIDERTSYEQFLGASPDTPKAWSRYAFGTGATFLTERVIAGRLQIEFERDWRAGDIDYIAEVSSDLKSWKSGPGFVKDVTPMALLDGQVNRKVIQAIQTTDDAPNYFMRVRAVKK